MGILDYMDTDPEKTGVQMQPVQMEDVPAAAPFNVEAGNTQFQVAPETLAMLDRGKVQAMDVNEARKIIQAGDFVFNKMPQAQAYDMQAKARAMADAERAQMTGDLPPPPPPSMMDRLSTWAKSVWDDEEQMTKLALAFNTMRLEPDQTLAAGLMKRLDKFATLKAANKSLPMLRKISPQLAALVEAGAIDVKDALTIAYKNPTKIDQMIKLYESDPKKFAEYQKAGMFSTQTINLGATTKGWEDIDKKFAEEWNNWTGGGRASAFSNIASLNTVVNALEGGEQLTGNIIGLSPDVVLRMFNPNSLDARQRVERVVQQSLKEILGAQFTENEAKALVQRSYDAGLPPQANLARLKALTMTLKAAADAKDQKVAHFGKGGTLEGFQLSNMPTIADFEMAMENAAPLTSKRKAELNADPAQGSPVGTIKTFTTKDGQTARYEKTTSGADGNISTWKKVD